MATVTLIVDNGDHQDSHAIYFVNVPSPLWRKYPDALETLLAFSIGSGYAEITAVVDSSRLKWLKANNAQPLASIIEPYKLANWESRAISNQPTVCTMVTKLPLPVLKYLLDTWKDARAGAPAYQLAVQATYEARKRDQDAVCRDLTHR